MKTALLKIGFAFSISLFFSWVYLYAPESFYSLDNKLRDFMFLIRGELPKNHQVTIIDIDEKALKQEGQWPWSRNKVASLITILTDSGAGIIGLDMVFAEPDRTSPHRLKASLSQPHQNLPNYDKILAQTFATSPVVGGYTFSDEQTDDTNNSLLIPAVFLQKGLKGSDCLPNPKGMILNIPILQSSLYSSGFFNTRTDTDGVIRSTPLIQKYKGDIYPSLALEMLRIYSGANRVNIVGDEQGVAFITFGKYKIPTNSAGELLINFRGAQKHFKYISAADILNKKFSPADIKNRFILIGTSALGLKDLRATPFDSTSPGVEVHANIIDNVLKGDFINKPFDAKLYDLMIIWVIAFVLMLLFSHIGSLMILPVASLLLFLLFYGYYLLMFQYGLVLTLITPFLAFISTLIFSLGIDYIITSKHKEEAKRILGKKVSPSVMQHLLKYADTDLVAPKEVETTIFFSDIRDFTTIAEELESPTKLINMLNSYMTPMVDTVIQHKGTIDKFIGDAIMAYWNAPVPVENHADGALKSALEQMQLLKEINKSLQTAYGVTLNIGIGIHTGLVTAGDMGSAGRSDYTIIGDNVNLASRLESLTKLYGVTIIISKETHKRLQGNYPTRPLDIVAVKGKSQAIEIFEVLTDTKNRNEELNLYKKALARYRSGEIATAYEVFSMLSKKYPGKLYTLYTERCKRYIKNKNLAFDPVFKILEK